MAEVEGEIKEDKKYAQTKSLV